MTIAREILGGRPFVTPPLNPSLDERTASSSGLSWAAIAAGALAAAAASTILTAIGSGIGLSVLSPWAPTGAVTTFAIGTAIWLVTSQWIASAVGGYLAGRLRTRWPGTHAHEVFFRDTAHGFLAWALATFIGLMVLAAGAAVTVSAARNMSIAPEVGATNGARLQDIPSAVLAYDVDTLFRSGRADMPPTLGDARLQAGRILAAGAMSGALPAEDQTYLVQLVAQQTEVDASEAQRRVDLVLARQADTRTKMMLLADDARKASARLMIFTALSMMVGAFIASVAAALGGHQREIHP